MVLELSLSPANRRLSLAHVSKSGALPHAQEDARAELLVRDLRDDFAEVLYLAQQLDLPAGENFLADRVASLEASKQELNGICRRQMQLLDWLSQESPPGWGTSPRQMRNEYLSAKLKLRQAYRDRAHLLCSADWQSPVYAASIAMQGNRHTARIAEHSWDYKRDGHMEALAYEESFVREYIAHLGEGAAKAYLTASGMAAFSTALHWLAHELAVGQTVLALEPMYFENIHLAQRFFPDLIRLQAPGGNELYERLCLEQPTLIICDSVTNCNSVLAQDIETILRWARQSEPRCLAILLDTTCTTTALLPADLLQNLPDNLTICLVESLAKHHQFGMDTVTGGIAVLFGETAIQDSFRKTRARFGGNISDVSAAALPPPDRLQLESRMQRHSRNVFRLLEQLEQKVEQLPGAIEQFSWLKCGPDYAPDFRSSCFSVHFHDQFKSIAHYREFETAVLQLCASKNLPLALSTSFGFDITRLYITAPSTPFEPPFLRVAVGTETSQDIDLLAHVFTTVHVELGRKWQSKSTERTFRRARTSQSAEVSPLKTAFIGPVQQAVFAGENALREYLDPDNIAIPPLVELPADLNPHHDAGVRIFAKIMPLVPLMNIKSLPAFSMLSGAQKRNDLSGVKTIIESSSGNTVLSLSVLSRLFGIDDTRAIVDHSIAPSLLRMLRLFGINVMLHPGPGHDLYHEVQPRSKRAKALAEQDGWLNPGQYENFDNPAGFAKWLGPQLWSQTGGRLAVLSSALGTCGTIYGVGKALKARDERVSVVACAPLPGQAVPGPREHSQLKDVAFPWQQVVDSCLELSAEESFAASVKLLRRGIMGGPSSGMNYAGLLRYLDLEKASGRLPERISQGGGEYWCVFMCCDSPLAHVEEYFDVLNESYFPAVQPVSVSQDRSAQRPVQPVDPSFDLVCPEKQELAGASAVGPSSILAGGVQ